MVRGSDSGAGTVGSVFAFALALWVGGTFGWAAQLGLALVLTVASLWSAAKFADTEGDAGWIVIDEAAGMTVAIVGLSIGPALVAFVVFRVADIFKVPGVEQAERLPGAVGITADDVLAGIYALVVGHVVQLLWF
jgi:phosphatidylglycerophosphatase A